eukprot:3775700-Rhodomonas_salina.1
MLNRERGCQELWAQSSCACARAAMAGAELGHGGSRMQDGAGGEPQALLRVLPSSGDARGASVLPCCVFFEMSGTGMLSAYALARRCPAC